MVLFAILLLLISVFIQGIIPNYLGYIYDNLTMFSTIYVLVTLLVLTPYFVNKKKYFILLIVFGLIIDITYTNTVFLNVCLFIICYYFSRFFHFVFPYNLVTVSISNILSVFIYHIISFVFLSLLKYDIYGVGNLFKILSHSILMTIIYSCIIYVVVVGISKKFQLKEVK